MAFFDPYTTGVPQISEAVAGGVSSTGMKRFIRPPELPPSPVELLRLIAQFLTLKLRSKRVNV